MTHSDRAADHKTPLEARSSGPLTGRVRVPGDKSISHRALILGALAVGETRISGLLEGEDVLNTAKSMRALGAKVERTGDFAWKVEGVGVTGFAQPEAPLDFGNSGTGCRLVMGAVAGCPITAVFDGDASLRSRPMRRVLDPLELMGARVASGGQGGRLPLTLDRRARSPADPLPDAGCLRPDQVRRAAGGLCRAGRDDGDRKRSQPRPHRTDAAAFRSGDRLDAGRPARPQDRAHRSARTARRKSGRARRSVVGGLSDRGGADRRRLGSDFVRRHDQSAAHRAVHDAARDGRIDRGKRVSRRCRRADGGIARARLEIEGRRSSARARALDDRRISGAGGGGELCRRHHHHAGPERIAGQGIRPACRRPPTCCASTASRSRYRATT